MKRIRINIILGLLIAGVYSISDVCGTSPTSSTSAIVDDSYKGPMSQFLRLKGPIKPTETMGIQEFETIDGDSFRSSDYVAFADPTYDQTFKALFTGDVKIDGFCGTDRLMSLLNGIYYPEADSDPNAYKIREITPLDGGTYKCLIKKEGIFSESSEEAVFYLEFYRKPELNLQRRLWWHAAKLLQMFHNPVKILVFASFADQAEKDASFWIMPYKMDTKTGHPISAIEKINIQSLDLRTISQQLLSNENIIIQGKQLRKAGREWLKLLSVGQWQDREGQFNLLMSDDMTPEVVSAIKTLSKK